MAMKKGLVLAVALFASTLTGSAFADASQDSNLVSSTQTYQLIPGTTTYSAWANWIGDKLNTDPNIVNYVHGVPVRKHFYAPVNDTITIKVIVPPSGDRFTTGTPDGTPPSGPPTPLPVTGTPGEQITIVDQTHTYYASWTYEWKTDGGGGGDGGWDLVGSSYHACDSTNKSPSTVCQPL